MNSVRLRHLVVRYFVALYRRWLVADLRSEVGWQRANSVCAQMNHIYERMSDAQRRVSDRRCWTFERNLRTA